jgi:hypothetical protein
MTSKDDIKGLVSSKFLRLCSILILQAPLLLLLLGLIISGLSFVIELLVWRLKASKDDK